MPSVMWDTDMLMREIGEEQAIASTGDTAQDIGVRLSKRLSGYSAKLGPTDEVVVMGIDSATPGRMAIRFYRELTGSELLARLHAWHEGCCWPQRLSQQKIFIGAPAPKDIAEAAYGRRIDDELRKVNHRAAASLYRRWRHHSHRSGGMLCAARLQ